MNCPYCGESINPDGTENRVLGSMAEACAPSKKHACYELANRGDLHRIMKELKPVLVNYKNAINALVEADKDNKRRIKALTQQINGGV